MLPAAAVLAWLAIMAFFAFVVAPAAFGALEREAAGRFVTVVFPRYYAVGAVLGMVALGALAARGPLGGWRRGDWLSLVLLLVMLSLTLYAWLVLLPAAHAAREAARVAGPGTAEALRFTRLHRLSGILNGAVMAAGVLMLVVEVVRRR